MENENKYELWSEVTGESLTMRSSGLYVFFLLIHVEFHRVNPMIFNQLIFSSTYKS